MLLTRNLVILGVLKEFVESRAQLGHLELSTVDAEVLYHQLTPIGNEYC